MDLPGCGFKLSDYNCNLLDHSCNLHVNAANGKTVADAIKCVYTPDPIVTNAVETYFIHSDHSGTSRRVSDDSADTGVAFAAIDTRKE